MCVDPGMAGDSQRTIKYQIDMPTFKVIYENELYSAENPLDAAKSVRKDIIDSDVLMFTVINEQTGEKFSVDLSEDDEDAVLPITQ